MLYNTTVHKKKPAAELSLVLYLTLTLTESLLLCHLAGHSMNSQTHFTKQEAGIRLMGRKKCAHSKNKNKIEVGKDRVNDKKNMILFS